MLIRVTSYTLLIVSVSTTNHKASHICQVKKSIHVFNNGDLSVDTVKTSEFCKIQSLMRLKSLKKVGYICFLNLCFFFIMLLTL